MASVTSLDGDLRRLRLDKYTPAAANEARSWIEGVLGERLAGSDLLEGLKDGVALCRLANLAVPSPGIRFKRSAMPFVQMENISHFLRVCQASPLSLQQHDVFLTVDLYEAKDPAQVLQCLGAFSRAANRVNPAAFPTAIGPRSNRSGSIVSPQSTGNGNGNGSAPGSLGMPTPASPPRRNGPSTTTRVPVTPSRLVDPSGRASPGMSPTSVTTWSKRDMEGSTAPAWNIAQYGYIGGASQGNLGISFGGRRQITSAGPHVVTLADKERARKEKEAEQARLRQEEEERRRREELAAEERRWEEETQRLRDEEKRKVDEERRQWEEEERQWKLTEERRRREEEEAEARLVEERQQRLRSGSNSNGNDTTSGAPATGLKRDARLHGQYLSQYQAEQGISGGGSARAEDETAAYGNRVRELEQELEQARQREQEYERERRERAGLSVDDGWTTGGGGGGGGRSSRARSRSRAASRNASRNASRHASRPPSRQDSWSRNEPEVLRTPRSQSRHQFADQDRSSVSGNGNSNGRSLGSPFGSSPPPTSPRPLPDPRAAARASQLPQPPQPPQAQDLSSSPPPPLPHRQVEELNKPAKPPAKPPVKAPVKAPAKLPAKLPSHPLPQSPPQPPQLPQRPPHQLPQKPAPAPAPAQKPSWAGKSLLEREMEMERQRQREWEESQKETAAVAAATARSGAEPASVDGLDGRWDVSQWGGYTGGDSQNRGAQGIGAGRRQIVGPRPLPGQR